MEIVNVKNVYKSYAGKEVLSDISLSMAEGEIFGLIGPSGVGKTTLIKLITAQVVADGGSVSVFGCNTNNWKTKWNQEIGIMIDTIGCYSRMTCYENLELYCQIYGLSPLIINDLLEAVDLSSAINKKACELSKGMRQRLLFARAILNSPKLLIMDEPTSDLDPKTTLKIHHIIAEEKKRGTSILLTTHDMQEASEICDTIGLMYQGKFVEYGKPQQICNKYNLKPEICIIDKKGGNVMIPNDSSSANIIYKYFIEENISSISLIKPNLNQIFLKLTGCDSNGIKV